MNNPFTTYDLETSGGALTSEVARKWGLFLHLSLLGSYLVPLAGVVAPIIIWQLKRNEHPELDAHGKMVVNWMISSVLYLIAAGLLSLVFIGIPFLIAIVCASIAFPIIGGIRANEGRFWRYPLTLGFLK
jgi:uncharacterized Tic20 family protein